MAGSSVWNGRITPKNGVPASLNARRNGRPVGKIHRRTRMIEEMTLLSNADAVPSNTDIFAVERGCSPVGESSQKPYISGVFRQASCIQPVFELSVSPYAAASIADVSPSDTDVPTTYPQFLSNADVNAVDHGCFSPSIMDARYRRSRISIGRKPL